MTAGGASSDAGSVEEGRAIVANRYGLHARPAAELVKLAGTFVAEVRVAKGELEVNGKSIMGVLMLAAEQGTELLVRAEGPDAGDAVEAIQHLIEAGFGEH